ncbi:MAG TPA: 4Fe-4S cluster-binding domain-containing protein [Anaeromyxobacteraceae bacterium]|nr:4Fe-4S cluster-binding domain-containing protein [Anaeromyxobacteraceae bacterium]
MRVVFEEDLRCRAEGAEDRVAGRSVCLVDLHLPCNMACEGCDGASPHAALLTPSLLESLSAGILARVDEERADALDLALYGGEPLLDVDAVVALSADVRRRCAARGVAYAGHLITNGSLLADVDPERLALAGIGRVQVTLDGVGTVHDRRRRMLDGTSSFGRVVEGLRRARGRVTLLVRATAESLTREVEDLLCALDTDGLLAGDPDVALFVARPASYAQQARDLVRIFPLLEAMDPLPSARA